MLLGIVLVLSSLHVCRALLAAPAGWGLVRSVERLYRGGGRAGFLLELDGRRFQLDLERDESAPVERALGGMHARRHCAYRGTVDSRNESLALFQLCGGRLRGFFAVDGARYTVHASPRSSVYRYEREGFSFEAARGAETRDGCGTHDPEDGLLSRSRGWERRRRRRARSVSRARHVELLLVADESMMRKYGSELRHYLLTLASIASRLYGHASIENPVRLAVVKVTVLKEKEKGLEVSRNAAATLKSFCKWQNQQNPLDDDHEHHHDAAILFTRQVKKEKHVPPT